MTDYVAPPKRKKDSDKDNNNDYVVPQKKDDYVSPPKKDDYVSPPKRDDYVAPPKKGQSSSSDDWKKNPTFQTKPSSEYQKDSELDPQIIPYSGYGGYFDTPKQDFSFYLTGYLVISLLYYFSSFQEMGFFGKIFWFGYILLSNYTYSWYADYRRFKGGILGWFFTPYGGIRSGFAASSMMDYSTGKVKRGFFGGYKMKMKKDIWSHLFSFMILTIIIEAIKYMITTPIAFISLFFHKSTVRKYVRASEEAVRG